MPLTNLNLFYPSFVVMVPMNSTGATDVFHQLPSYLLMSKGPNSSAIHSIGPVTSDRQMATEDYRANSYDYPKQTMT